jgi:hypothetical protein
MAKAAFQAQTCNILSKTRECTLKKETEMEPHQTAESETNKRLAVYNL